MKQREIDFGTEPVSRILLTLAPPVMLAQLIQALYNIVDSFFIGSKDKTKTKYEKEIIIPDVVNEY